MTEAENRDQRRKEMILERVTEIIQDYMFDCDEKRAVIHMEFEKVNGESQSKTLWFVKDGYKKDGTKGQDELRAITLADLMSKRFYPSFLDNPSRSY